MYDILFLSLIYLSITSIVLIRNIYDFKKIDLEQQFHPNLPKVSICIPVRNEELVIRKCLDSVLSQNYKEFEIIVIDDNSTDNTKYILEDILKTNSEKNLKVIQGLNRPNGWLGKNWACQQLGLEASGDFILFIDADTWMKDNFITSLMTIVSDKKLDAITVWPHQVLVGFWEKVVIPQVYFVIHTLLPVRYTSQDPKWVPKFLRPKIRKYFAAACGQCIGFKKQVYRDFGGHAAVKNKVVEDVEFARLVRENNKAFEMRRGLEFFFCRMYQNSGDIFNGFRKNFLAGFGNNIVLFIFAGLLHFMVFILPIVFLCVALFHGESKLLGLSLIIIGMYTLQRLIVDLQNDWGLLFAFTHSLGVIWFQVLSLFVISDKVFKRNVKWKDREVKV
jgi:chlorobactene glucosyltransferase